MTCSGNGGGTELREHPSLEVGDEPNSSDEIEWEMSEVGEYINSKCLNNEREGTLKEDAVRKYR